MNRTFKFGLVGSLVGAAVGCCISLVQAIMNDFYSLIALSNVSVFFAALGLAIGLFWSLK
jgi:uncharacterized membrane protein